jgi:hypothetical protein
MVRLMLKVVRVMLKVVHITYAKHSVVLAPSRH